MLAAATRGMNRRFELTEVGPDMEALRSEDRPGIPLDLGFGLLQVDAFVRPAIQLLPPHCDGTSENPYSQRIAVLWPLFWTPTLIVFLSAAWVAWKSSREFRRPTGRALKVRTRMFCPSSLHMAGRILQLSHCQAIGAVRPFAPPCP